MMAGGSAMIIIHLRGPKFSCACEFWTMLFVFLISQKQMLVITIYACDVSYFSLIEIVACSSLYHAVQMELSNCIYSRLI